METKSKKTGIDGLTKYFNENEKKILDDYFKFLRFPSVSTESKYISEVNACAQWLMDYLEKIGFDVELWPTKGHPTLFASNLKAGPDKPTLLIYNHYDVQPIDPIQEWVSPPFEPTIRNGEVYARGASDNKGQCFYTIQALKALLELEGTLPINIKLCIEGEEEAGSAGLAEILEQKKEDLQADYLAIVDLGIPKKDQPAITLGIRGLITMDVEVQGSDIDLHSGSHGGLTYNPIHALIKILSSLRDAQGKITIPGFYDDVQPLSQEDRKKISLKFDEKEYQDMFGAHATGGEKEFSPMERVWTRPALEINGINGGYSGSGFKTVIPAKAIAKVSCRLVPNQDPQKIGELVARYIENQAFEGIKVRVNLHAGKGKAVRADCDSAVVQAFSKAYQEVFQKPTQFIFEGASIPIVTELTAVSGAEVVLVGVGLADDKIHAPNEHFGIDRLKQGFLIMATAIENLNKGRK